MAEVQPTIMYLNETTSIEDGSRNYIWEPVAHEGFVVGRGICNEEIQPGLSLHLDHAEISTKLNIDEFSRVIFADSSVTYSLVRWTDDSVDLPFSEKEIQELKSTKVTQ